MDRDYQEDLAICEKATPGPWEWRGNTTSKSLWLISSVGMREIVMDFVRWGTQSAQPRFNKDGLMEKATCFMRPRASHHQNFDLDLNHPDAEFIAMTREALPYYITKLQETEAELQKAQAEAAVMRKVLVDISQSYPIGKSMLVCPKCKYHPSVGHHHQCIVGIALSPTAGQAFLDEMKYKDDRITELEFALRKIASSNDANWHGMGDVRHYSLLIGQINKLARSALGKE